MAPHKITLGWLPMTEHNLYVAAEALSESLDLDDFDDFHRSLPAVRALTDLGLLVTDATQALIDAVGRLVSLTDQDVDSDEVVGAVNELAEAFEAYLDEPSPDAADVARFEAELQQIIGDGD